MDDDREQSTGRDVWVLWRDTGAYSDWDRVVLGVYAALDVAQAAARQDADTYRPWWADASEPSVPVVLGEWEQDTEPSESWTARRIPTDAPRDEMDYTAARYTVGWR
jgi:hypothetical protein